MSALGQKQTWRGDFAMSALLPKADIGNGNVWRTSSGSLAIFTAILRAPSQLFGLIGGLRYALGRGNFKFMRADRLSRMYPSQ
jgi:hypothetical protein